MRDKWQSTHEDADKSDEDDSQRPSEVAAARQTERLATEDGIEREEPDSGEGVKERRKQDRPVSETDGWAERRDVRSVIQIEAVENDIEVR